MTRKRKAYLNKMPLPITIELTLTGQRERFVSAVMKKYLKEQR